MQKNKSKLITIGYAKNIFIEGSREQLRMMSYARHFESYHSIIFTNKKSGYPDSKKTDNLQAHATNTKTKLGSLIKAVLVGRKIIKTEKGDFVVSSQDPFEASLVAYLICIGTKSKLHIQIHGDVFNKLSIRESTFNKLRIIWADYVIRQSSMIRVVSKRIKSSLTSRGIPIDKIVVLPISSDREQFLNLGKTRVFAPTKPTKFLYVGRFSPEKNLKFLIKAFSLALKTNQDITLTLMGEGNQKQDLQKQVSDLELDKKIQFVSWCDEVAEIMIRHDVLCLSSQHEGWGMVMVEAAATQMPVICTDVGAAGEFIINYQNGIVVPVADQDNYVKAIMLYDNKPELIVEHGQNGYEQAKEFYQYQLSYIDKLVKSYQS